VWWSISGIIFQLIAGVFLALPYICPGKMQKIDQAWHEGRGKVWVFIVIWAIIVIVVLTVFGVSNYSISALLGALPPIFVWMYFVNLRFGRLIKRLPKRLQHGKYGENIRYEKLVSANLYTFIWALIGWVVSSGAIYVVYTQFKNLTSLPWFLIPVLMLIFIDAFCFSTFILAGLYLILDMVSNAISKRVKKPLWAAILGIFVVGCVLQIVGVAIRG
jgi:MFS family permease